jgi:uncharacterized DUF497 family protein
MYEFDGFDWSDGKRAKVLLRGLDIATDGPEVIVDPRAVTASSPKEGEDRFKTTGMVGDRLHTVVHTPRNGKCRIITMRRAHKDEEEAYYGNLFEHKP